MATPKKSTAPKKTKESKKPSSKATTPKKTQQTKKPTTKKTNTKISNGNVSHSDEVPVTSSDSESEEVLAVPSSSSDSGTAPEQNGLKITKKPTPKSKNGTPKSKPKRKQKGEESEEEVEEVKSYIFPMERVRRIMKCGGSNLNLSQDAVFLVNKATEKFLEKFAEDSCAACVKDRKKSLAYKHLSTVVSKRKRYDFLADYVPEKIKAEDALAKRKLTEEKAG